MRVTPVMFTLWFASVGFASEAQLKPFTSDGCSLFPDENVLTQQNWCDCCFIHDIAYWQGGTEGQRLAADVALRDCISKTTGDEALALVMYEGVRLGGSAYFYNGYRWGYGWPFPRGYQALTGAEQAQVAARMDEYLVQLGKPFCGGQVGLAN